MKSERWGPQWMAVHSVCEEEWEERVELIDTNRAWSESPVVLQMSRDECMRLFLWVCVGEKRG